MLNWEKYGRSGAWTLLGVAAFTSAWVAHQGAIEARNTPNVNSTATRMDGSQANPRLDASRSITLESRKCPPNETAQVLLDRWKLESVAALLERIMNFHRESDDEDLETALMALGYSIKHDRRSSDAAAVADIVRDPHASLPLRIQLLHQLVLAGTEAALTQILEMYRTSEDPAIRAATVQFFPQMQAEYRISREREDLTRDLVAAFKEQPDQSPLLGPLAELTASFGAEEGITFLMDQVFAKGLALQEIENSEDPRLDVSLKALRQVHQPAAIPALANLLAGYDPGDPHIHLAGQMLAQIADEKAAEVLVKYAAHAPADFGILIATWVQRGNTSPSILKVLLERESFDCLEVKTALLEAVRQIEPDISGRPGVALHR